MRKQAITKHGSYSQVLKDIRFLLEKAKAQAYKAVDNIRVQTYWQVGERIVREELGQKRADYGKKIIELLADDLKCSRTLIFEVVQFYRAYPIVHTLYGQLSWSHYRILIQIKKKEEKTFYENSSIRNSWSVRELKKRINSKEFERAKKKGEVVVRFSKQLPAPEDVFKESYNWDFITLSEKHTEKQLENALLNNIQKVLLEFGKGFAFLARQQKVLINNQWHKVDLLFYHILLKCYIIVELKARDLMHGDIEQVTKYLTYFKEKKIEGDKDPIALVICKSHDKIDIYYSAGKKKEYIFVAEYKTKLPTEQEIKSKLKKLSQN